MRCNTTVVYFFSHAEWQPTPQSEVKSCRISTQFGILWLTLLPCKNKEGPMKNVSARVVTRFSPLLPYGSYLLQRKPEFLSDFAQNLMQAIPLPNDAPDEI